MTEHDIHALLQAVAAGDTAPAEAAAQLAAAPMARLSHGVCLDLERPRRTGIGEAVFAQGKSPEQLEAALAGLREAGQPGLATRVTPEQGERLVASFPDGEYWPQAGLFCVDASLGLAPPWPDEGDVMVVSAGASDMPVALEALGVVRFFGISAGMAADAGVAGLHRILPSLPALRSAKVCIVVAGMEGALPSVVAGMCATPIIAVPTSVGYGASFGGLAALLGMLNTCAPGVAVVNIDNGFGAAAMAARILERSRSS